MRILYIVGCNEGESKRYRVFNLIEGLRTEGFEADWAYEIHEYIFNNEFLEKYNIVVLFRCGYSKRIGTLIEMSRKLNIPVIYDVDDLVFDPDIVNDIPVYDTMTSEEKKDYLIGINSINRVLLMCDYVTASTKYLCNYISRKYNKPSFVIPNGINKKQIEIAEKLSPYTSFIRYIGYLSGTRTHQKDFYQVAEALKLILNKYPDVFIKIVGFLDTEEFFSGYEDRIIKIPFMKWEDLVIENSNLYINLAPLNIDSPFNHAKSELKYFEAGLCRVPTICSPTEPYIELISNGVNGYLAHYTEEWFTAMDSLLCDSSLYHRMRNEALTTTKELFFPSAVIKKAIEAYSNIINHKRTGKFFEIKNNYALKKPGLKISFVIPQPFEGSGGHRNIFRTIKYLSRFGHELTVYINPDNHRFKNSVEVNEFIKENFFDIEAKVVWWTDDIKPCDVLFATHWSTAYIVEKNRDKAKLNCYFIQDFEPYFYPMGYEYVIAHNTYKMGLYPITSGPWPLRLLERDFGITEGNYFRFPIDRNIYYTIGNKDKNHFSKIAFFARPDMPRRCYHLGVQALELVKKSRPNVEIVFFGAKSDKYQNVPFEFTNLGILPEISELGELYRSCDIGICFSTTNPSLVPYEMMACGCAVVDLDFNDNVVNYGCSENVMLVDPNPQSIAQGVIRLLDDFSLREKIRKKALEYVNTFPEEEEMVRLIEKIILEQYKKKC